MPAKLPAPPSPTTYRLLAVTAAALAVTATAPVTLSEALATVTVSPTSVTQGAYVTLAMEGCGSNTVQAVSSAFDRVNLDRGTRTGSFSGRATVLGSATPGTHEVTFECGTGTERIVTSFQVVALGAARGGIGGSIGSMSPSEIAVGGALVASALGAGVWVMRRRVSP